GPERAREARDPRRRGTRAGTSSHRAVPPRRPAPMLRRRPSGRSSPLAAAVSSVERTPRLSGLRSATTRVMGADGARTRGFCNMDVRRARAIGAALTTFALAGTLAAPALASPGVTVSTLSSLKAGRTAGTLGGKVINRTGKAATADVTVRLMRY